MIIGIMMMMRIRIRIVQLVVVVVTIIMDEIYKKLDILCSNSSSDNNDDEHDMTMETKQMVVLP